MRGRSLVVAFLCAFAVAASSAAQQQGRAFTTEDALDVRGVRIADVTEDGRWVAATVQTRRDRSNVDHYRFGDPTYVSPSLGELLVIDTRSGESRSLFGKHEQLRGAAWSPDGARLAFFKLDGDAFHLYVHDAAAGRTRMVALKTDRALASNAPLVWSPDGRSVLVSLRPDGWAAEARKAFLDLTDGPVVVQDSRDDFLDWDRVRGLDELETPVLVDVASGAVRELPESHVIQSPSFSEDGSHLGYSVARDLRTSYERAKGTEFVVVSLDLGTGRADTLVGPVERRVSGRWNQDVSAYAWAERGNVYVRTAEADSARDLTREHRGPVSAKDTTKLSYALEAWRPDGGGAAGARPERIPPARSGQRRASHRAAVLRRRGDAHQARAGALERRRALPLLLDLGARPVAARPRTLRPGVPDSPRSSSATPTSTATGTSRRTAAAWSTACPTATGPTRSGRRTRASPVPGPSRT